MRIELDHFTVGESYGGDQEKFSDPWMKMGGCGAVTACDLCIYLARHKGMTALYPFDPGRVTLEDYLAFGMIMRTYLSPRPTGIHKTETYISGFNSYLDYCGARHIRLRGVGGGEEPQTAVDLVRDQIDRGFPVPYLMLRHRDKKLKDFMWHWFLLNGYDESGGSFKVKAVSYGEALWMDLRHLWRTGRVQKGGLVLIYPNGPESPQTE